MAENVFDRVNDYGSVKIQLASPNDIRSWSFGEVKKPRPSTTARTARSATVCSASASSARSAIGVLVRQVQGHEVQGHHLRPLRRQGDALARPS